MYRILLRQRLCACVCVCVCVCTASRCLMSCCGASRVAAAVPKHGAPIAWMPTVSDGHRINSLIMPCSDALSAMVWVEPQYLPLMFCN